MPNRKTTENEPVTVAEFFDTPKGQEVVRLVASKLNALGRQTAAYAAWDYIYAERALASIDEYFVNLSLSEMESDSWANTVLSPEIFDATPEEIAAGIEEWMHSGEASDILSGDDDTILLARRAMLRKYIKNMWGY